MIRKPYPSDVTDDEWAFVTPYLILMKEDAQEAGIELIVVKLPEAKKGFVPLPRRWVVDENMIIDAEGKDHSESQCRNH